MYQLDVIKRDATGVSLWSKFTKNIRIAYKVKDGLTFSKYRQDAITSCNGRNALGNMIEFRTEEDAMIFVLRWCI